MREEVLATNENNNRTASDGQAEFLLCGHTWGVHKFAEHAARGALPSHSFQQLISETFS